MGRATATGGGGDATDASDGGRGNDVGGDPMSTGRLIAVTVLANALD